MKKSIQEIKRFNRFYLRMMGLFNHYTDESPYSVTEAIVLFEIQSNKECTASFLSEYYMFDKGYISRIVKKFENRKMIMKIPSKTDRRIQFLNITKEGENVLEELKKEADLNVERMIQNIKQEDLKELIKSMKNIENILQLK